MSLPGEATVGMNSYGQITLSSALVEAIKLKPGDRIAFAQDEDHAKDWYMIQHPDGLPLRLDKGTKVALRCQSSAITKRLIVQFAGTGKKSVRFQVATTATKDNDVSLYALITSATVK